MPNVQAIAGSTPRRRRRMGRSRRPWAALALALATVAAIGVLGPGTAPAVAHAPPPVYIAVTVDGEAIGWEMMVMAGVFRSWTALDAKALADLGEEGRVRALKGAEALLESYSHLEIDQVTVAPHVEDVQYTTYTDHAFDWEYVRLRARYGSKGVPRQLAVGWTNFEGDLGTVFEEIQAEVTFSGTTEYYVLRESEPGIVWHRPSTPPPPRRPAFRLPPGPTLVVLPLVSVGLLLLLLLALPWLRRLPRRTGWVAVAATGALALLTAGWAPASISVGARAVDERPSKAHALYTFESLLRNIYRAFDYDREDAIYDTLAESVTGDLLDRIYAEVYASLVLQEEGGAVCKVEHLDVLDQQVEFPPGEETPWFRVRARWRVHGKVGHWGHTHIRVNEYDAVYTLVRAGEGWRIADVQVLEQARVDDGAPRGS